MKLWAGIAGKGMHVSHISDPLVYAIECSGENISLKVFGLKKRNFNFWKWQTFSFKMVCDTYKSENNGFYIQKCINFFAYSVLVYKMSNFYPI